MENQDTSSFQVVSLSDVTKVAKRSRNGKEAGGGVNKAWRCVYEE